MTDDEGRVFGNSDADPLAFETTQNVDDLLAFLEADALDVYDDLDGRARAFVDRIRREYRQDLRGAHAPADVDTERLLKQVAVDQYRESVVSMVTLRQAANTAPGDDIDLPDGVIDAKTRLADRQHDRLRRLGIYPVDTGGGDSDG